MPVYYIIYYTSHNMRVLIYIKILQFIYRCNYLMHQGNQYVNPVIKFCERVLYDIVSDQCYKNASDYYIKVT